MTELTAEERRALGCTCWAVVPGKSRHHADSCAGDAVERIIADRAAVADYRLTLLRTVVSYDDANQSDLPIPLLDSIRAEVANA